MVLSNMLSLILGPITSIIAFIKPENVQQCGDLQQFKRLQHERGRTEHDIWQSIPDQRFIHDDPDEAEIVNKGLLAVVGEGSEAKLKNRVTELEHELQRIYKAYGELRGLHERLWHKYIGEKMEAD